MFSIIVPVYKTEPYLARCVESILRQTYQEFELILVDDGSPDRCPVICDEYARRDSRIKVIHSRNEGVSAARNKGLAIAAGEYITFVDSDDWLGPRYLQDFLYTDCDLVCQTAITLNGETRQSAFRKRMFWLEAGNSSEELEYLIHREAFYWTHCKRYKRAIIQQNKIRFDPSLHFGEDTLFTIVYAKCAHSILIEDRANYYYAWYQNRETLSNDYLSAEKFNALTQANVKIGKILYPQNQEKFLQYLSQRSVSWFHDYILHRLIQKQSVELLVSFLIEVTHSRLFIEIYRRYPHVFSFLSKNVWQLAFQNRKQELFQAFQRQHSPR